MNNLRLVIALRHSSYIRGSGLLTELGKKESEVAAAAICKITKGVSKIALLVSPKRRTKETAAIVSRAIGVEPRICQDLACEEYYERDIAFKAVEGMLTDEEILIVVTHGKIPSGVISEFRQQSFQQPFDSMGIDNGQAIILDLQTGEISFLIP